MLTRRATSVNDFDHSFMNIGVKGAMDIVGTTLAMTKIPWLTITRVFHVVLQF